MQEGAGQREQRPQTGATRSRCLRDSRRAGDARGLHTPSNRPGGRCRPEAKRGTDGGWDAMEIAAALIAIRAGAPQHTTTCRRSRSAGGPACRGRRNTAPPWAPPCRLHRGRIASCMASRAVADGSSTASARTTAPPRCPSSAIGTPSDSERAPLSLAANVTETVDPCSEALIVDLTADMFYGVPSPTLAYPPSRCACHLRLHPSAQRPCDRPRAGPADCRRTRRSS